MSTTANTLPITHDDAYLQFLRRLFGSTGIPIFASLIAVIGLILAVFVTMVLGIYATLRENTLTEQTFPNVIAPILINK